MTKNVFEQSVTALVSKGKRYRDIKRQVFAAILAAAEVYQKGNEKNKDEYDNVLDNECESLGIKNISTTTYLHKLTKLAIGDDTNAVSAMVHVLKVAINKGIKSAVCRVWLQNEGGFQEVRTTYYADGSKKPTGGGDAADSENGMSKREIAEKANIARDLLKGKTLYRVAAKALQDTVEPVLVTTERIFIGVQQPDGSLEIKAIVPDEKLVQAALAQYANSQATDVIEEVEHDFKAAKEQYNDLRETPPELKGYVSKLRSGDMSYEKNSSKAEGFYQDALEELEQALEQNKDVGLGIYLDRDFDADSNLDPEGMPRLRNSKSNHNQSPLVKPTKDKIIKTVILSRQNAKCKPSKVVDMRAMLDKATAHAANIG